jgi:hypothetical protein
VAPGRELLPDLDRVHPRPADTASLHTAAAVNLVWN